eukprot:108588-Prorocentrum_minimum.AAC.1
MCLCLPRMCHTATQRSIPGSGGLGEEDGHAGVCGGRTPGAARSAHQAVLQGFRGRGDAESLRGGQGAGGDA